MPAEPIPVLRYGTADLPPAERYGAWLNRDWPRNDLIFRTEPYEPFDTLFCTAELGEVVFAYIEITGMRWERRLDDIRTSDYDPIAINLMTRGHAQGDLGGRAFRQEAGMFHFHDLAKPSVHVSTASRTFAVIVPRAVALRWFGTVEDLHGLVVAGPVAKVLFAHAEAVWASLTQLTGPAAAALGRTFLELLVAALAEVRVELPPTDPELALRRRAEREIERQGMEVTVGALASALMISRSRLYALFQQDGGVMNFVVANRLERAREALADLDRAEPIGQIATRLGFAEASHLSRAFRQRFGMAPRDYRRLVAGDTAA